MQIIGAGMAGLLAAAMLRDRCCAVVEQAPTVPNNHRSLLRFRSAVVADALGLTFKKVQCLKAIETWRNPVADAMAYAQKTTGAATLRSIVGVESARVERWIAPPDLVTQMARLAESKLRLGENFTFSQKQRRPIISTIPMPMLAAALKYERQDRLHFRWLSGRNLLATLPDVDVYCTLYVPDPTCSAARISLVGNQLIAECYPSWADAAADELERIDAERLLQTCLNKLGILRRARQPHNVQLVEQKYAKILPIDDDERRHFIMWASDAHGVYSLGRFATWRPGLLLDDVVNDVRVICRLIDRAERYHHKTKV